MAKGAVFVVTDVEDYERQVVSIHATKEGAEGYAKHLNKGRTDGYVLAKIEEWVLDD